MADAKISALPTGASVVSADIIPYVNILSSVTAAIGVASLFTNTIMQTVSVTGGTLTRMTIASPSVTGTANFAGAVIVAGSPFTVTGASITSGTLTRGILTSPSITGGAEFANNVIIGGLMTVTGASITSGTITNGILTSPSITGTMNAGVIVVGGSSITAANFSLGATAIGGLFVTGAASALGYLAGAGGTVTQSIGGTKEQAVALNTAVGKIILSNSVMAASVLTSVLFGNSVIGVNDILALNYIGNGLGGTNMRSYQLSSSVVAPGSAIINLKSQNNFADASSIFVGFVVIKGSIT